MATFSPPEATNTVAVNLSPTASIARLRVLPSPRIIVALSLSIPILLILIRSRTLSELLLLGSIVLLSHYNYSSGSSHTIPVPIFLVQLGARLAFLVHDNVLRVFRSIRPSPHDRPGKFRFEDLPVELRSMIYDKVLGEHTTIPTKRKESPRGISQYLKSAITRKSTKYGIMLANKQLHEEFMDVTRRKATFVLQCGYGQDSPWPLTKATLQGIRNLELQIAVTAEMLGIESILMVGVTNFREAPSALQFRQSFREKLAETENLRNLSVHVQAIPDHLWNPVFLWLYTLQALKESGFKQLYEVTFGMKDWAPSDNKAVRQADGKWKWVCPEGHILGDDPTENMNVRQFCVQIFQECAVCPNGETGSG